LESDFIKLKRKFEAAGEWVEEEEEVKVQEGETDKIKLSEALPGSFPDSQGPESSSSNTTTTTTTTSRL
jgi:hypothetical protein